MHEAITRSQVAEHVGKAFSNLGTTSKSDLVHQAKETGANSGVIELLKNLPDRNFANLRDLWSVLPVMPIE